MATVKEHIADFRGLIKKHEDDTPYVDQFLYSILNKANSKLEHQKALKFHKISDFTESTFCIELEKSKSHNCDCVAVGCDVLKSIHNIPEPLVGRNKDLIKVETLGGILIPRKTEQEVLSDNIDDIKSGRPGWMLRSRKLIIWNELGYKSVQVTANWADITQWNGIQYCDSDTPEQECSTIYDMEMGISATRAFDVYSLGLQLLRIPLTEMSDITNDSQPEIKV